MPVMWIDFDQDETGLPVGPYVWYRGEDLEATLADGDPVTTWVDRTGNGFDLTVPSGGYGSPTFRSSDLNGLGTVDWAGTNDALINATCDVASHGGVEWTMFAVFLTNNDSAQQEIVNGDNQTAAPGTVRGPVFLYLTSAGVLSMIDEGSVVVEGSGQTVTESAWHVGESWRSSTQMEALLDGAGNGATNDTALTGSPGIYLGYHPASGSVFLDGKIAEVIGWDRLLTSGERGQVHTYFNNEYGV